MQSKYLPIVTALAVIIVVLAINAVKELHRDTKPVPLGQGAGMPGPGMGGMPGMSGMPMPGMGMPGMSMPPVSTAETGANGAYTIIGGTLIKYSLSGLKRIGKLDLNAAILSVWKDSNSTFGPQNIKIATGSNKNEYVIIHFMDINKVLIVDSRTMKVCGSITLPTSPQATDSTDSSSKEAADSMISSPGFGGPYGYSLQGDMIYITDYPYLVQVNFVSGKIISKTNLSDEVKKQ